MQVLDIALLSVVCAIALLYCFLGSRFFRAIFTFTAFLAGLLAAYLIAGIYFTTLFARIAITLTGGLISAILFNQLQFAGRFITGVFAGFAIGILFAFLLNFSVFPLFFWDAVMVVSLVLGISAAVNKSVVLRASTAVSGAFIASLIVFFIISRGGSNADFKDIQSAKDAFNTVLAQYRYMIAGSTALLTLAGLFLQFFLTLRKPQKNDVLPYMMYLTPPLLEDPSQKQDPGPGRYFGKHVKLDR